MKPSVATLKKWTKVINEDYMHLSGDELKYVMGTASRCDYEELPEDSGVIAWVTGKDFDCKKRMYVVLLYCRPERRGRYLIHMMKRLEAIAAESGVTELIIGQSISGYKEKSFNRMLGHFGYTACGYSKRIGKCQQD